MEALQARIVTTVELLQRRGYAVSVPQLAQWLVGGVAETQQVQQALGSIENLCLSGGLVHACDLPQSFVERSQQRQQQHPQHCHRYWNAVLTYAASLAHHCPQVRCVALAGSMSSGGFVESDDVDFNLFVADGSRYTTYLMANILALGFALAHRHRPTDAHTQRLFLPKLMSINVIWCDSDTQPFVRQDGPLALELLLSRPLLGHAYYQRVLGNNPWLAQYFPQLLPALPETALQPTPRPAPPWLEQGSRQLTYWGWRWVMWTRRHNPEALARVAFVRRCQHPYALFEDLANTDTL
ncbi:hypothetical protein [Candidatus Cyanaurora vandensis]|uniref:hypothetical protein n=1 Tax=Candidatus Cyanaurora vandensis TaxID=2714958 RepID=UPI0025810800|nr:hypothetical protein [Candidatus Cyanaurora vandensis]